MTWFEEVVFYRLIVNCDDYGRMDARPKLLKSTLFPIKDRVTVKDVEGALHKLADAGCVVLYEVKGKPYLYLPSWEAHQNIRAKKSKYPAPESGNITTNCKQMNTDENICKQMNTDENKCPRNPIQSNPNPIQSESAQSADEIESCFLALWDLYPTKVDKSSVSKKAKAGLHKVGFDVVSVAIENYKAEMQRENRYMKYVKNGSTFFNGAWKDYLESSELSEEPKKPKRGGSF